MKKAITSILFSFLIASIFISCNSNSQKEVPLNALIPRPNTVSAAIGAFEVGRKTRISVLNHKLNSTAMVIANELKDAIGYELELTTSASAQKGVINLILNDSQENGHEAYELSITHQEVVIKAESPAGIFYGFQTLKQLLVQESGNWFLPSASIEDQPKYSYRGSMLDVSRHFFDMEDVKQYIDYLAMYKMNYLHLHLADDQGWRIEIKSWPNLTTHGGSTEVGGGEGGFFTQDQYREIVDYAKDRFITIVPEIDMPGHTNAALASYAELNCDGKARELYTGTNVGFSSLCVDKEITYEFIDDVIKEVAALTPGPYIHVGGDESHATEKEDYLKFINRAQTIVRSHGKEMIGWDETAQANLSSTSVTQLWASPDFAREAMSKGAKLIMSPATHAYLDMKYDSTTNLGLSWAGYIEVDKGYSWDPDTLLSGITREHILGIEAPLWSETVTNMDEIEYMIFPRLAGYAEIGWSGVGDWEEYRQRLAGHGAKWAAMGINFYQSPKVDWK